MANFDLLSGRFWSQRRRWVVAGLLSLGSLAAAQSLIGPFENTLGSRLQQVVVSFAAPGSRAVRLAADDGSAASAFGIDIPVVDDDVSQDWAVEIQALPEHHPSARSDELWVFAIRTPEQRLGWRDVTLTGRWNLQTSMAMDAMDKRVGVVTGSQPNRLTAALTGSRVIIVVGQGEYSGKVRITVNGEVRVVDLYAPSFRLTEVPFLAPAPADYGTRRHQLAIPRGTSNELQLEFTADNGPVQITEIALDGRPPSTQSRNTFGFTIPGWSPHLVARLASSIVSMLLVTTCVAGAALFSAGHDHRPRRRRWDLYFAASFALSAATIGTLLFYPGIFNEDALARWSGAMALRDGEPLASLGSWYPPLMAIVMAVLQSLSGEFGLATWVQTFSFYLCFALVSFDLLGPRAATLAVPLLAVMPPLAIHAIALSPDAGTAIGLMACFTIIWRRRQAGNLVGELSALLAFVVSCTVLFGFRYNTIALLPLLLVLVWSIVGHWRMRLGLASAAIAAAVGTAVLPQLIGANATRVGAIPMLWEHVGMMKEVNDRARVQGHRLDHLGDTDRALSLHFSGNPDNLFHGPDAPFPNHRVLDHAVEVRAAYWRMVREHPLAFIINRARMYRYLMAIPAHLYRLDYVDERSIGFDPLQAGGSFNYVRNPDSPAIVIELANQSFVNWPIVEWLMRPWFAFTALAAAALIALWARGSFPIPVVSIAVLAVGYYATFFVVSTGAAFRYFFPSFVLLQLVAAAAVVSLWRTKRLRLPPPI